MRKVELLPTRDCEAGYGPEQYCAWTMNPFSVHGIINRSKVINNTSDYIEQRLGLL